MKGGIVNIAENSALSNFRPTKNAVTSAKVNGVNSLGKPTSFLTEKYQERLDSATALAQAIADCGPRDACRIMEAALVDLSNGAPIAPFISTMNEARDWAFFASRNELKAYIAAIFDALNWSDRSAFLAFAKGRAEA